MDDLRPEHACLIYQTAAERRAAVGPFMRAGMALGERCEYILNDSSLVEVVDTLDSGGIDVPAHVARGAIRVMRAQQMYLRSTPFDPQAMIEIVRSAVAEALADGYSGLRVIGEMGWAVDADTRMKSLVDYERELNEAVSSRGRLTGLCLYDAGLFGATVLREIADSHHRVLG